MNGCHNCQHKPKAGTKYENSLCSKCPTVNDPRLRNTLVSEFKYEEKGLVHYPEVYQYDIPENEMNRLFDAYSSALAALLEISERNLTTFKVLRLKLKNPKMSYAEMAELLGCKKQNISYHLRLAMKMCPELKAALLIDSRFCRGQSIKRNV